jgi:hypothetical protein
MFLPEFLNRLDDIIIFQPLRPEELRKICDIMIKEVTERVRPKQINLIVDDKVKLKLTREGYNPLFGARPLRRLVTKYIEDLISENILKTSSTKKLRTIKIQLNENGRTFFVDGRELVFGEKAQLKNLLVSTCHFDLNEMHKTDLLVAAYEHADKFVELDFVNSIEHRNKKGLSVNIMRIGESIYINKINKSMAINEFFKAQNATKAVEIVKEFINYDITPLVEDLLSEEVKTKRILESKKNDLLDRINFLKEERNKLGKLDNKNEFITEAYSLLTEEMDKFQKEFNTLL